ncbi:MAG: hypothetical protein JST92_20140 [Deltaproteobacteria bacterium]|nr:hypothetical protein [Deltaproteobacteria bacterium]
MGHSRRALVWTLAASAAALCACAGQGAFVLPKQPIPTVHFDPLTSAPEGTDLRKANEERLAAAREQFRDLDAKRWDGSGPWWIRETTRLVTWVDGQTVLIAVAEAPAEASAAQRKLLASEKAKAEAGKAFKSLAARVAQQKGTAVTVPAEVKLKRVQIESTFEFGERTWALALCDRECLEANGRAVRVTLAGVALVPGTP